MRRLMAATAIFGAAFAITAPASAADLSPAPGPAPIYTKAPMMAPVWSWTGFYVGGNAGYAWGHSDLSSVAGGPPTFPPGYFTATSYGPVDAAGQGKLNPHSFVGGAQAGYNWQVGHLVAGLEADFDYFHMNASRAVSGVYPCCAANSPFALTQSVGTNWLFTARPRLGYAADNWLLYATGGVAVTDISTTQSFSDPVLTSLGMGESLSASSTKVGWAAGAGVEYGVTRHWSLRAEYLHVDFGSVSGTGALVPTAGAIAQGDTVANSFSHSANLSADMVRLGANYKF
jgi:outer membrane immunogenic protein